MSNPWLLRESCSISSSKWIRILNKIINVLINSNIKAPSTYTTSFYDIPGRYEEGMKVWRYEVKKTLKASSRENLLISQRRNSFSFLANLIIWDITLRLNKCVFPYHSYNNLSPAPRDERKEIWSFYSMYHSPSIVWKLYLLHLAFFFCIVVGFVIHWNESAMGLHVFPIPIPPPTSLSTRSL